jgi:hypothetical protein
MPDRRFASLFLIVAALGMLAGCGNEEEYPTGPGNDDQIYTQTILGTALPSGEAGQPMVIVRSGTMTLTLTWADPTVNLNLYVTAPGCSADVFPGGCQVLASSTSTGGIAESIVRNVTANQQVEFWIDNVTAKLQDFSLYLAIE